MPETPGSTRKQSDDKSHRSNKHQNANEYVPVYTAYGQLAGEMIKLLLESMEIPAILSQESAGAVYGLTVGPLGEVKVLVPGSRVSEAQEILQAMEEGKLETHFPLDEEEQRLKKKGNKQDPHDPFTKPG